MHNGHTPSESDGFAGDFFGSGLWKDNHYPNVYAGVDQFGGIGDPREAMRSFWYHDHRAEFTAPNNYLGLNGQYILYDSEGSGTRACSAGLAAAAGLLRRDGHPAAPARDPVLSDRQRPQRGIHPGGGAGQVDKWIINGKIQPKLTVRRRKYRFRILNTGPAKEWNISLIGADGLQKAMTVVAVDGNFTEHPFDVSNRTLNIPVATRYDIIIDFSQFAAGTSVYLREARRSSSACRRWIPRRACRSGTSRCASTSSIGSRPSRRTRRRFRPTSSRCPIRSCRTTPSRGRFTRDGDPLRFRINGQVFDHNRIDHAVLKGSSEEWVLANDVIAGTWTHPVHIHFEEGRIMSRSRTTRDTAGNIVSVSNVPLLPEELGRRDVYRLPAQERLVIRMRFRDFVGRYLIHCHNMNHEDDFMMVRWDIVNTLAELTQSGDKESQFTTFEPANNG